MAGGNGRKKRKRKRGRRMKRKPGGSSSSSSSASSDDVSPQPVEEQGGLVVSGGFQNYEFGWHNALFVGTKGSVDIMASLRNQLLNTCFICAILYAAEQDIRRWLAIEEPDRKPDIYFDYDTYVAQYEAEVQALIGQDVNSVYRTREDMPRTALKVFLRDGVRAYSKSKEWPGGKIIKITHFLLHKDMIFEDFQNIIDSGGSIIGGFPVSPEFKKLGPNEIYEFSPVGVYRKSIGAHMVQFIGTGTDASREFLVFLNSKKRPRKDGVGKIYFDQIYKGVYTLECRAPPPPPPSGDGGLIAIGPHDNDDTLGSSGAAPDGNNKSSFSGAPDGNEAQSSTAPIKSLSQVGKQNRYADDPISSWAIKTDGWVPSAPALLAEDILFEVPWKKKNLDEMGTVTRCFAPSTKMNDLHFTNALKINDKLGGLNSKLPLEHRQMIPIVIKILTIIFGRDLSHGSSGLSDIPSSARFSKTQHRPKHKQPISASGPANSSGTMNTTGPFPSLASSTPSTIAISMPLMYHNAGILSPLAVCGADAAGTRETPTDQIADMYRFLEDDWLGHNMDSFFSRDDSAGLRDARSRCMACTKGFTFREIYSAGASANKLACFHSSSDGKLLATGRHDMELGRLPFDPAAFRDCSEEAICHKESAIMYANMSLCKLLMGDGEAVKVLCRILFGAEFCGLLDCAKPCYRHAGALMLFKQPQEYKQARDTFLDAQMLDPGAGNADIKSEPRKARELMKNPPVECA